MNEPKHGKKVSALDPRVLPVRGTNCEMTPAQDALVKSNWVDAHIPGTNELLAIPDLFIAGPPWRIKPQYLNILRDRVMTGRVSSGSAVIDRFIDQVLANDLVLESYFIVGKYRAGIASHPLARIHEDKTPFQAATEVAWGLSRNHQDRPQLAPVMHAAGLLYPLAHFMRRHPFFSPAGCPKVTLDEIRKLRSQTLKRPLAALIASAPEEGVLLADLLLGVQASQELSIRNHVSQRSLVSPDPRAQLFTQLHLETERISHMWHAQIQWSASYR